MPTLHSTSCSNPSFPSRSWWLVAAHLFFSTSRLMKRGTKELKFSILPLMPFIFQKCLLVENAECPRYCCASLRRVEGFSDLPPQLGCSDHFIATQLDDSSP
uniref:Uncharacterized protein MANES_05G129200 n=1 Tax=Rhizophora mucronata TaxID=61149 RepID=A0A2P2KFN1_RHIMU